MRIFYPLLIKKTLPGPLMKRQKQFHTLFLLFKMKNFVKPFKFKAHKRKGWNILWSCPLNLSWILYCRVEVLLISLRIKVFFNLEQVQQSPVKTWILNTVLKDKTPRTAWQTQDLINISLPPGIFITRNY